MTTILYQTYSQFNFRTGLSRTKPHNIPVIEVLTYCNNDEAYRIQKSSISIEDMPNEKEEISCWTVYSDCDCGGPVVNDLPFSSTDKEKAERFQKEIWDEEEHKCTTIPKQTIGITLEGNFYIIQKHSKQQIVDSFNNDIETNIPYGW